MILNTTILWPCLLKLEGDDELIYLNADSDLQAECRSLIWGQEDYVVDSHGHTFGLQYGADKKIALHTREKILSVEEVTTLIQSHEFSQAQRCIIKIKFTTVQQAVSALGQVEQRSSMTV